MKFFLVNKDKQTERETENMALTTSRKNPDQCMKQSTRKCSTEISERALQITHIAKS